jgi:zona occludens toxin
MIVFHEGMPGSGKSYAAMRDHIIPALQKGRKVFARMNGLNRDKIAEVSNVERHKLDELLLEISEDEVLEFCRVDAGEWKLPPDCLVVLDELQNFYPQKRAPLDAETIKFIAEHRHRGMDILIMGQLLKDCHRTWVNRTNRKVQFLNRDVVGKANEYRWKIYNGQPDSKGQVIFNEVTGGNLPYDKTLFGTYKSFQDETTNTERMGDDRANVFKSKAFRVYLPALGLAALVGLGYTVYLFRGGLTAADVKKPVPVASQTVIEETGKPTRILTQGEEPKIIKTSVERTTIAAQDDWPDVLTELAKDNRIRLASAIRSAKETRIIVEFRDKSNQVIDQFNTSQLKILGWGVMVSDDLTMVSLSRLGQRYLATSWPIAEPVGKPSKSLDDQIHNESKDYIRSSEGQSSSGARTIPAESGI